MNLKITYYHDKEKMSNKSKLTQKIDNRVGDAFVITHSGGSGAKYVRVKTVNGAWSVVFRDDTPQYAFWMSLLHDESEPMKRAKEALAIMYYQFTNMAVDEEFVTDFYNAFNRRMERYRASVEEATREEQDAAIEDAKIIQDLNSGAVPTETDV
jgi:hypothetical protein